MYIKLKKTGIFTLEDYITFLHFSTTLVYFHLSPLALSRRRGGLVRAGEEQRGKITLKHYLRNAGVVKHFLVNFIVLENGGVISRIELIVIQMMHGLFVQTRLTLGQPHFLKTRRLPQN